MIEGFTVGIAVIIFLQQVPAALGVAKPAGDNTAVVAARAVVDAFSHVDVAAVVIVLLVVVVMLVAPRAAPVAARARCSPSSSPPSSRRLANCDVARIGSLPSSLPMPSLPAVSIGRMQDLLGAAFAVALLAAIESLLSAKVADGMADTARHDPDRELFGQGLANLAAPLFGGMPATGAIARTAVNVRAGARTRLAAIVHSVVLILVVLFVGGRSSSKIPLAALAGVLMVTAVRMVEVHNVRAVLPRDAFRRDRARAHGHGDDRVRPDRRGRARRRASAAILALRNVARDDDRDCRAACPTTSPRSTSRPRSKLLREHIVTYRLDGALFFGAAQRFLTELTAVADVRVVILRLPDLQVLDATGAHALGEIVDGARAPPDHGAAEGPASRAPPGPRAVGALDRLAHENHLFSTSSWPSSTPANTSSGPTGRRCAPDPGSVVHVGVRRPPS